MPDEQAPSVEGVPEPVLRLAADRALGAYEGERGWGSPARKVGVSLLAVLAAVLGEIVIHLIGLVFLHLVMLMLFVGGVSNAIAALVRGRQDNYLFAGGLVHRGRNTLRAIEWREVARLGRSTAERQLTGGRRFPLHLTDGRTIAIPLVRRPDGTDPFIHRLAELLRQHGRPVE